MQTSENWATYNGLETSSTSTASFNLDLAVPGDETTSHVFDINNSQNIAVELWEMSGSSHTPSFGNGVGNLLASRVVEWLLSHRKSESLSCDFDSNSTCDLADIDALTAEIVAGSNDAGFDLDSDGVVDRGDLGLWLVQAGLQNIGAAYLDGDANLDGFVDVGDFNAWNANKFTMNSAWSAGDFNTDGLVDVSDFGVWNNNKFSSANDVQTVPEPQSWLIVCSLMLCLLFKRRF